MLALFGPIVGFSLVVPILVHFGIQRLGAIALAALGAVVNCSVICPEGFIAQMKGVPSVVLTVVLPWAACAMFVSAKRFRARPAIAALGAPLVWAGLFVVGMLIGDVTGWIPQ
ncbi:MAG: hypothetical protein NTW53_18370 [Burkholderiales bacterium]|nr:hypothetical protein [Burkholderiales bacterium]